MLSVRPSVALFLVVLTYSALGSKGNVRGDDHSVPRLRYDRSKGNVRADDHSVPRLRYDRSLRVFESPGHVSIAALIPITFADKDGQCTRSSPEVKLMLLILEPFLFILRRYNFSLTATLPGRPGEVRQLRLGMFIADQCVAADGLLSSLDIVHWMTSTQDHLCSSRRMKNSTSVWESEIQPERILAMIGPWLDADKIAATGPVSSAFELVQIAARSFQNIYECELEDFSSHPDCLYNFQYLFHTGANGLFQAFAIADLLKHFGWTHFAIITDRNIFTSLLLTTFLQRVNFYSMCPAFVAQVVTESDANAADDLLRRHPLAKVVIVFADTATVKMLIRTVIKNSAKLKQPLPKIWIGNDRWGSAIELPLTDNDNYQQTMQASIAFYPGIPPYLTGWQASKTDSYLRTFSDFLLGITAGQLRRDPYYTANPLLCEAMEAVNNCSRVCRHPTRWEKLPKCADNATFPSNIPPSKTILLELVDPFIMIAAEILLRVLQNLFQEMVNTHPSLDGQLLADKFYKSVYGPKLWQAVRTATLPCNNGKSCHVFAGYLQGMLPTYRMEAVNFEQGRALLIGKWTVEGQSFHPARGRLDINSELISFGRDLFPDAKLKETLPLFVHTKDMIPPSTCVERCRPGFGRVIPVLACCRICVKCREHEFSVEGDGPCQSCPQGEAPNQNKTDCYPLPIDSVGEVVFAAVGSGLTLLTVITVIVLAYFRNMVVVRSSDRVLTFVSLFAMALGFSSMITHVLKPTTTVCITRRLLYSSALMLSTIVVLVKTSRFARIYLLAKQLKKAKTQQTMQMPAQGLIIAILLSVGMAVEIIGVIIRPPQVQREYQVDMTLEVCVTSNTLVFVIDVYLLSMITATATFAFLTRKLPFTFRETYLLLMVSFSQCTFWAVLRPLYYLGSLHNREVFEFLLVILHLTILWLWLHLPRLYVIILRPHRRDTLSHGTSTAISERFSFRSSASGLQTLRLSSLYRTGSSGLNASAWSSLPSAQDSSVHGKPTPRQFSASRMNTDAGKQPPQRASSIYTHSGARSTSNGLHRSLTVGAESRRKHVSHHVFPYSRSRNSVNDISTHHHADPHLSKQESSIEHSLEIIQEL